MNVEEALDLPTLDNIAAALDLRRPNREAVETIAMELARHYDVEGSTQHFEGVVDSATGVGKTFIFAAALDYLAQVRGVRDFVLVAPSRTILQKTVDQFTLGNPKCIVGELQSRILLVTADTFDSPSTAAAMDDDAIVKLYVFTVQSLIKPGTKQGRRTHEFQEGLGSGFYDRLRSAPLLTVFADEHHAYYGEAFSRAVRELKPWALIGLTATPHKKTPDDQIIFRYPLAAAIADHYVKTPVIVGRSDDRRDKTTKLMDGIALLEKKRSKADEYASVNGLQPVNSIMLVVAEGVDAADQWADVLRSDTFLNGAYKDAVLVVHSEVAADTADEAKELRRIQDIEAPGSPIRVVVSVQMLKEGWDVKNVYVLLSTRPLVSELLAEQVLGRGLRLPFGSYTGVQLLDTLEVLAHEKFEELLQKKAGLNEQFIDYKTRSVLSTDSDGRGVIVSLREDVENTIKTPIGGQAAPIGAPILIDQKDREDTAERQGVLKSELVPSRQIVVPRLRPTTVKAEFSLSDITDLDVFSQLGRRVASDPEGSLRRVLVGAKVVEDESGIRQIRMTTEDAADTVGASTVEMPLENLKADMRDVVLAMPIVSARDDEAGSQGRAADAIVNALVNGMGVQAQHVLSAFFARAASELIARVNDEYRRVAPKPIMSDAVDIIPFGTTRYLAKESSSDRYGAFVRTKAYEGWKKSLYSHEWFDSSTELVVANAVDKTDEVDYWVRLHRGELGIIWTSEGRQYNPDFIVHEATGDDWVVEVKMDKEADTRDVQAKRNAASRWVNRVNNSGQFDATWHYVLVTETDVRSSKGSWSALKQLGV